MDNEAYTLDRMSDEQLTQECASAVDELLAREGNWQRKPDGRVERKKYGRQSERRHVDVQQLWGAHKTILDLSAVGFKNREIAEMQGVTPQTVCNIRNSELGQERLRLLSKLRDQESVDVMREVTRLLPKALAVYEEVLDDETASRALQVKVADTLICRISGHEAAKKLDVRSVHLNGDDLAALRARGKEAARLQGILVQDTELEPNKS